MNRALYLVHRWLGLVIALQLLAWSLGGLVFSLLDLDDVHGDMDRRAQAPAPLPAAPVVDVATVLGAHGPATRASLVERRHRLVWLLERERGPALVDARTGALLPSVDESEARAIALADLVGARGALAATLITGNAPLEYRDKPLPAWRVVMDHDKDVHLYVHALTGEVTARRNAKWRVWDFFWMLHIMDYGGREDFQHPLLTACALLAVLASTSGLVLWGARLRRRVARPRAVSSAPASPAS